MAIHSPFSSEAPAEGNQRTVLAIASSLRSSGKSTGEQISDSPLGRHSECRAVDVRIPAVGETAGDFEIMTIDGEPVSRARLVDETLVAFFVPGCDACVRALAEFVAYAGGVAGGRERILAVITGRPGETAGMVEVLHPVAKVIVDRAGDTVSRAFRVGSFPAFCVVDGNGTVVTAGSVMPLLRCAIQA